MPTRNLANIDDLAAVSNQVVAVMEQYKNPAIAVADQQIAASEKILSTMMQERGDMEDRLAVAEAIEQSRQSSNPAMWENIITAKLAELGNPPRADFEGKVDTFRAALDEVGNRILKEQAYAAEVQKRKTSAIREVTLSPLSRYVAEAKDILSRINGRIQAHLPEDEDDTRALVHKLGEIAASTPDGLHADFLQRLEVNAKAAMFDREGESLRQQFRDKFASQLTPGAKDSVDLTATSTLKFGFLTPAGDGAVSNTWECKASYEVAVSDLGEITVKNATALAVDVGVGGKWANKVINLEGKLKGAVEAAKENKYDSVDDFVNSESDRMARGFLDAGLSFTPLSMKNFLQMRKKENRTIELRDTARSQRHALERDGAMLGFIEQGDSFTVPAIRDVDYTTTESTSAAVNLSSKFTARDPRKIAKFEIGGSAEIKKIWERETHTIGYLDHLTAHPAQQEILMIGRPHYFRINTPAGELSGERATRELNDLLAITRQLSTEKAAHEESIATAQAVIDDPAATQTDKDAAATAITTARQGIAELDVPLTEIRRRMREAVEHTAAEYSSLVQLDNLAGAKKKTPEELSVLRKTRGTSSTVEHLKALSAQFAILRRIYSDSFTSFDELDDSEARFELTLTGIADEFSHPAIAMDIEAYEKHFKAHEVKEGKKYKYKLLGAAEGGITKFAEGYLGGEVERSGKWNPKTGEVTDDTHTFRAKIKGGINLSKFVTDSVAWANTEAMEAITQQLTDTMVLNPLLASSWPSVEAGFNGTVEWTVVKKHDQWRLKQVRASTEESVGIGGTVPLKMGFFGADMGLKAARKRVRGCFAWMGTDNLDAWADAYEGLKLRRQDTDWAAFKQEHTFHLDHLLDNLKNAESGITKDMSKAITDIGDSELEAEWDKAMSDFRAGTIERAEVLTAFEKVMDKRVEKNRKDRFKGFTTRASEQTIETYALQSTADAILEQAGELGLAPEQATGVDAIVAEARRVFKAERSEANYKKVQKALALEHAVLSMEDMLASKNPKRVLAAHAGMVNGSYFQDAYKKPKVYIDKGISGELVWSDDQGTGWLDIDVVADKGTRGPDDIMNIVNAKTGDLGARINKVNRTARDGSEVGYFDKKHRPSMVRSLFSTSQRKNIRAQLARVLDARVKRYREWQERRRRMQQGQQSAA